MLKTYFLWRDFLFYAEYNKKSPLVAKISVLVFGGEVFPTSFLTRLGFDRWKLAKVVSRRLERDKARLRWIAPPREAIRGIDSCWN
jgi:hypothetical protein